MLKLWTRILRIFDLHFGSGLEAQLRDQLEARCRQLKPHFIVVSGDLVDHPFPWLMARARCYLDKLASAAKGARLIVVPGNHDYKLFGNFGLRSLSRVPYQVYSQAEGQSLTWQKRLASTSVSWPARHSRGALPQGHRETGRAGRTITPTAAFPSSASTRTHSARLSRLARSRRSRSPTSRQASRCSRTLAHGRADCESPLFTITRSLFPTCPSRAPHG